MDIERGQTTLEVQLRRLQANQDLIKAYEAKAAAAAATKEKEAEAEASATTTATMPAEPDVPSTYEPSPKPSYSRLETHPKGCPHVDEKTWPLTATASAVAREIPVKGIRVVGVLLLHKVRPYVAETDGKKKEAGSRGDLVVPDTALTTEEKTKKVEMRNKIRDMYKKLIPVCIDLNEFTSSEPGMPDIAMMPTFAGTAYHNDAAYYASLQSNDDIGAYQFEEHYRKEEIMELAANIDRAPEYEGEGGAFRLGRALVAGIRNRVRLISTRALYVAQALGAVTDNVVEDADYTSELITAGDEGNVRKYRMRLLPPDMLAPSRTFTVYVENAVSVTKDYVRLTSGVVQPIFAQEDVGNPLSLLVQHPRHVGDDSTYLIQVDPNAPTVPIARGASVKLPPGGMSRHGTIVTEYGLCKICVARSLLGQLTEAQMSGGYGPEHVQFLLRAEEGAR